MYQGIGEYHKEATTCFRLPMGSHGKGSAETSVDYKSAWMSSFQSTMLETWAHKPAFAMYFSSQLKALGSVGVLAWISASTLGSVPIHSTHKARVK